MKSKEIKKIIACIDKIMVYCENIDYDAFISNSMLVEACVFNISQIGELAKKTIERTIIRNRITTRHGKTCRFFIDL